MAITGMNADKFRKFGWRLFDLLKSYKKEHQINMDDADMSQLQPQYYPKAPTNVADQDEDEENYIDSDDDEDYVETGERSEYFASGSANFQPPGMSQAQRTLMEQVASATRVGGGGSSSSSKATSGARVKKAYGTGPKRGTKKASAGGGSGARRKRFSTGSATSQGGASRGGRSAGGRGAGGGGRGTSIIRPMS